MSELKEQARDYVRNLQDQICAALEPFDGQSFKEDLWKRDGGGGGRTRIFSGGKFLEKGGVNVSEVYGELSPEFAKSLPRGSGTEFYATGISLVLHPINPYVPTTHANWRFIQRGDASWFGGGADLTPFYPDIEDVIHFHRTYKDALDKVGPTYYPEFKKKCDEYFFLPHRNETRGIGGIFFDYLDSEDPKSFEIVKNSGNVFVDSYVPIIKRNIDREYGDREKEFQEIRRGRYVEFNLLYDRGTIFGLKTKGRIESILMSLPLKARWYYDYQPEAGTEEAKLMEFLKPTDWLASH